VDIAVDDKTKAALVKEGIPEDKFKLPKYETNGQNVIKFKRREFRKDGTAGSPFRVAGPDGKPWDQTKLIGNGSTVDVKWALNTRFDGTVAADAQAFRVVEHVVYEGKPDFEPIEGAAEQETWDAE
jgi:hypothetical protein